MFGLFKPTPVGTIIDAARALGGSHTSHKEGSSLTLSLHGTDVAMHEGMSETRPRLNARRGLDARPSAARIHASVGVERDALFDNRGFSHLPRVEPSPTMMAWRLRSGDASLARDLVDTFGARLDALRAALGAGQLDLAVDRAVEIEIVVDAIAPHPREALVELTQLVTQVAEWVAPRIGARI